MGKLTTLFTMEMSPPRAPPGGEEPSARWGTVQVFELCSNTWIWGGKRLECILLTSRRIRSSLGIIKMKMQHVPHVVIQIIKELNLPHTRLSVLEVNGEDPLRKTLK